MSSTKTSLRKGDIVVYNGERLRLVHGHIYFYVDDPKELSSDQSKVQVFQISHWASGSFFIELEDLEVVGHVEPFTINRGSRLMQDGNSLPSDKKELLSAWLGRRPD